MSAVNPKVGVGAKAAGISSMLKALSAAKDAGTIPTPAELPDGAVYCPDVRRFAITPDFNQTRDRERCTPDAVMDIRVTLRKAPYKILQAGIYAPDPDVPGGYIIVVGERRWIAGVAENVAVPGILLSSPLSPKERLETQIIENFIRENLSIIDEAKAMHRLMSDCAYTQQEVADFYNKNRSFVAEIMPLRIFDTKFLRIKELIKSEKIKDVRILTKISQMLTRNPGLEDVTQDLIVELVTDDERKFDRDVLKIMDQTINLDMEPSDVRQAVLDALEKGVVYPSSASKKAKDVTPVVATGSNTEHKEFLPSDDRALDQKGQQISDDEKGEEQLDLLHVTTQSDPKSDTGGVARQQQTSAPATDNMVVLKPVAEQASKQVTDCRIIVVHNKTRREGMVDISHGSMSGIFKVIWADGEVTECESSLLTLKSIVPSYAG